MKHFCSLLKSEFFEQNFLIATSSYFISNFHEQKTIFSNDCIWIYSLKFFIIFYEQIFHRIGSWSQWQHDCTSQPVGHWCTNQRN